MRSGSTIRAQLAFYLTSGRAVILNDDAKAYRKMRERAKVDLSIDPDADVRLYQAYQCYCSARDRYAIGQRERLNG